MAASDFSPSTNYNLISSVHRSPTENFSSDDGICNVLVKLVKKIVVPSNVTPGCFLNHLTLF